MNDKWQILGSTVPNVGGGGSRFIVFQLLCRRLHYYLVPRILNPPKRIITLAIIRSCFENRIKNPRFIHINAEPCKDNFSTPSLFDREPSFSAPRLWSNHSSAPHQMLPIYILRTKIAMVPWGCEGNM